MVHSEIRQEVWNAYHHSRSMKNPEDKLPLRSRIKAEWHHLVSVLLKPFGYKRVGTCRLCGREGFSLDIYDQDNFWHHLAEYHPEVMDPDA